MKFWNPLAILLLGMVTCTSNSLAQGQMRTDYSWTQLLYWLPSPGAATYVEVGIEVDGDTVCYPYCPSGVTHHSDLVALKQHCVGPNVSPGTDIGEDCTAFFTLAFLDTQGSVYGDVICSQVGTIASDPGEVVSKYWENQVAFVAAVANSANVTNDCTYTNDTSPDWAGLTTNPYGTQGSVPSPAIIEEMRLAYTSNSTGYGPFTPFPNGADSFTGDAAVDSGPWSGTMPQQCTQHASGKASYTPTWQVNP
jgi:hypothetical protein